MNEHLSELQIYELASGEGSSAGTSRHVDECSSCSAKLDAARRLLASVEGLDPGIEAPPSLEGRLEGRLARRMSARPARNHGSLARAAAAAVIFAAGAGAHALWVDARIRLDPPPARTTISSPALSSPALEVQRAGTDYVATIARLVADTATLSALDLSTGREVGLAAMVGAAHELRLLGASGQMASDIDDINVFLEQAWTGRPGEVAP